MSPSSHPPREVLDLHGYTVIPGLVGMHDHMYYIAHLNFDALGNSEPPLIVPQMTFSAPRMYLAAGVTTLRTTGNVEPYTDLNLRRFWGARTYRDELKAAIEEAHKLNLKVTGHLCSVTYPRPPS
jgi:hypothetical protein